MKKSFFLTSKFLSFLYTLISDETLYFIFFFSLSCGKEQKTDEATTHKHTLLSSFEKKKHEKMAIEMDLFRSEEMELVQLIIPAEAAHDTVQTLGSVGLVAFRDLNKDKSAFQKTYANQVKRCDEMLRKLRFFTEHMNKAGITIRKEIGDGSGGGRAGRFNSNEEEDGRVDEEEQQQQSHFDRRARTHSGRVIGRSLSVVREHGKAETIARRAGGIAVGFRESGRVFRGSAVGRE